MSASQRNSRLKFALAKLELTRIEFSAKNAYLRQFCALQNKSEKHSKASADKAHLQKF